MARPSKAMALRSLKLAAAATDRLRRPDRGVVVLIYHRVGRRASIETDLPEALFRRQMELLARRRSVATLDEALSALTRLEPAEPDPVVVTFDDGTADFVEVALPVMADLGIPSTLYLATDFVESQRPFPDDGQPLSWRALADAVSTGLVTVGSHTHTHALLDRLAPDRVAEELDRSVDLVGERLGLHIAHFAYPKAVPGSEAAEAAVRARFRSAALAGTRANRYGRTSPFRLSRSPVQVSDGMRWFEAKLHGGMGLEDGVRRLVNRSRYAGATT